MLAIFLRVQEGYKVKYKDRWVKKFLFSKSLNFSKNPFSCQQIFNIIIFTIF